MIIEKLQQAYVPQTVALQQQIVPYPIDTDAAAALYQTMQHRNDCCVLVARDGETIHGTVSGFCCHGLAGSFLAIEDLIVREELRGSGIGTKLMAAIHEFGKTAGCGYAILVSSGFRKQANKFYKNMGYTEDVRGFRKDL